MLNMSSAAVGLSPNAIQINEIEIVLAKPIAWPAVPILELVTATGTSTMQNHCKRGDTTLRWVLEDKPIIHAQSDAKLRLLRTHRLWPKNKLKLKKEWTLSFHQMLTNPYIVQTHDHIIIKVHFNQECTPVSAVDQARRMARDGMMTLRGAISRVDQVSVFLDKLSKFNDMVSGFANIHPYAQAAWTILSLGIEMIVDQVNRDGSIRSLVRKMDEVYTFLTGEELRHIESMKHVVERITHQTLECSYFIQEYSKNKEFRARFINNVLSGTDVRVEEFNNVFDELLQKFHNIATGDTLVVVHRIWDHLEKLPEDLDLNSMLYAAGAGLNTQKLCLEGTRDEILNEITDWINHVDDNAPRLFWLHGVAGSGKSAIAHTIAHRFKALGRLGSFFGFDRDRVVDQRHEKIFATIARDLADCHRQFRKALADAVHETSLKKTTDVLQQWKKLMVQPAKAMSDAMAGPIVIVIDALDESGDADSRRHILRILAGRDVKGAEGSIMNLPPHFRILLTSRLLPDFTDAFKGVVHVQQKSMAHIPSMEDVLLYVNHQLSEVELAGPTPLSTFSTSLARESDGLFEWARLACAYMKGENSASLGLNAEARFDTIMTRSKHVSLLDGMYKLTLETMFPKEESARRRCIDRFKSVMAQILETKEPLPLASLKAMRNHFVVGSDIDLRSIVIPMGALLSGTNEESTPIRALHPSFPEFLTDHSRSDEYFIDVSLVQEDLASSCLRVMEDGLRFNICQMPSSYLPNSKVPDLDHRIKKYISPELAYSCRFWTIHVCKLEFNVSVVNLVSKLFNGKLLFWFEALSLLGSINTCAGSLSSLIQWIKPWEIYNEIVVDAADARKFLRLFGGIISLSTPHLYLSALPFSPKSSGISKKFAGKFDRSAKIISDHNGTWSVVQGELRGHSNCVRSVAFSPNGKRIVSGSFDQTIRLWDAETKKLLRALEGHRGWVRSVAFSPDGKRIVSGSSDNTIGLWDAETGELLQVTLVEHQAPLEGHQVGVLSVAFSPLDSKRILSGSSDKTIRLWDTEMREPLQGCLEGHRDRVWSVAFSPDGKRVVSGSQDKTIRLWDTEMEEPLQACLEGHRDRVWSVAFSPDGERIVSGSDDKEIRLWDAKTGKPLQVLVGHDKLVMSVAFSPDGKRIVSGSEDQTIQLWDAETGQPLRAPLTGHGGWVMSVAFSPDGKRIVSGSSDSIIRLWNIELLQVPLEGHQDSVCSVAFSPDGKRIASGSSDKTIRLWDAETGKPLRAPLKGHQGFVMSVAFSPDGKRIVSGSSDKTIRLWDAETGEPLRAPLEGHQSWVLSVVISPDGKRIVSGTSNKTIQLWDVETGKLLRTLKEHRGRVRSVAFSPNGKGIASGSSDTEIRLWDAETGELRRALGGHRGSVRSVAFSPDGKCIVSGSSDKTIRLWDAETGKLLRELLGGHQDRVGSVAFSPDSKRIVSGSSDTTVQLWNAETGEPLGAPLEGHCDSVKSVAFSPGGKCIVSGSSDNTIRLWDAGTGELLGATLEVDTKHQVSSPTFSSCKDHALCDPNKIFRRTKMDSQGWFTASRESHDGELLFWVPPDLRHAFFLPGNRMVFPRGVEVDVSHMVHGDEWYRVKNTDC